ncbi:diguanylate cyclase [Paenisporosarcina cavernae]|uniref:GGDEF domain-containing protein n=1 Tax=Paenisporosarcina cavernae TaxID=2320858 RepID=A0A385YTJ0_9BACL|nr:diguanylate cyclase [Paenisporosarcina cavernae]AYC28793.1 GGDEF domain-containing protein [Paenisporosarcina cavernae]
MLLDLLINFSILFTFAVLSYWPFQATSRVHIPYPKLHPVLIGILAGITGLILMQTGVRISDSMFVDSRHVMIVISGILGGPIAPIVSGIIIGISRMGMQDMSHVSMLAGYNAMTMGLVIGFVSMKYRMTFRNAPYYFAYATVQTAGLIAYLSLELSLTFVYVLYFVIFSVISFFVLLAVLDELQNHFTKMREFEKLSETDYLTGLYNNRKFSQLIEQSKELHDTFSLLTIDIDHFKRVNDAYGHSAGDEILKELANRIQPLINRYDGIIARNGGEELVVFLPDAPGSVGLDVAEKVRSRIARSPYHIENERDINITVSIGVSTYPDNGNSIQELYQCADCALLEAKHLGRNRVVHYVNKRSV